MATYRIVRFSLSRDYSHVSRRVKGAGLTLEQAQARCRDPKTYGGTWFDGYEKEED